MPRNNGFSKRPHFWQLFSYLLFFGSLLLYSLVILPCLSPLLKIIFSSAYYTATASTTFLGWLVTYSDPTDDVVLKERTSKEKNEFFDCKDYEYYCINCDTHVADKSKHCKRCNRCVSNFDHHCKWVNNCIGGKNYKIFMAMIASVFISCGIFCFIVGYFTEIVLQSEDLLSFLEETNHFFETHEQLFRILLGFIWVFGGITFIFLVLDFNLILFHLWLVHKGISTYDYILEKREEDSPRPTPTEKDKMNTCPSYTQKKQLSIIVDNKPFKTENGVSNLTTFSVGGSSKKRFFTESINFLCFHHKKRKMNRVFAEESTESQLKNNEKSHERRNSYQEVYKKMTSFVVENGGCFDENVRDIDRNSVSSHKASNKDQLTALEFASLEKRKSVEITLKEPRRCNSETTAIKATSVRGDDKNDKFDFLYSPKQIITSKQITE